MANMKIGLVGLDFNSGNKGCEALAYAFLELLNTIAKEHNMMINAVLLQKLPTKQFVKNQFSIKNIKEYYHPKYSYSNLKIDMIMLFHTTKYTFYRNSISKLDYVIDFTGGDSFSDIYGMDRFVTRTKFKESIIKHGVPLILGSQTIGPFLDDKAAAFAAKILKNSREVFVRDELSNECVKSISGRNAVLTTDVAFALPYQKIVFPTTDKVRVGFNPSGLLWHGGYSGNNQFGLSVDYRDYCNSVIQRLNMDGRFEVHLILHSFEDNDYNISDNDLVAAKELHAIYPTTILAPKFNSCIDAKNYISAMDIFIGARMHATIAAYSSCVPVIPFSYSRKFEGLYSALGYEYVLNGRKLETSVCIEKTFEWIYKRTNLQKAIQRGNDSIDAKLDTFKSELSKILF